MLSVFRTNRPTFDICIYTCIYLEKNIIYFAYLVIKTQNYILQKRGERP
jgi:hypothetical protein